MHLNYPHTNSHCLAQACQTFSNSTPLGYLAAIFLCLPDDVLPRVNPVELLIQGIVINGSDIAEAVDGEYDIWALLLIYHHAINRVLLTEQQKGGRSWMG